MNHYQHESTGLVISTFAKQHESNELHETTLRISLQKEKKPKDLWSNLRNTKKKKNPKKYVQWYEGMKK